jgi:hypothetical protein
MPKNRHRAVSVTRMRASLNTQNFCIVIAPYLAYLEILRNILITVTESEYNKFKYNGKELNSSVLLFI